MFVRFIFAFILGTITIFLLMVPSAVHHGWSPAFTIVLVSGGFLVGLLGMLFSAQAWKNLFSSWADYFR